MDCDSGDLGSLFWSNRLVFCLDSDFDSLKCDDYICEEEQTSLMF